jgi:NAD(P)-dependent dehydrogenase (short-subunit alcohol dehydrogenase family)
MTQLAVITGAGTGIGRATAELLATRGFHVMLVGRTEWTLTETVNAITAAGGSAEYVVADVGEAQAVDRVIDALVGRPVHVVVHAAGQHLPKTFADTTREDFQSQVDVNLTGPFFLTQAIAPHMLPDGSVVFISSTVAERARDLHTAYAASKAALIALTKHLAAELGPSIRVNCVSPGATATAMLMAYVEASSRRLSDEEREATRQNSGNRSRLLLGRVATPEEVAATVVHLAVDATAVTGIDVAVDGGYRAS